MAKIALTNIKHGNPDGSVIEVAQGESVSKLPKDVVEELEAADAVGSPAMAPEKAASQVADLESQVAELQAKLAELQGTEPPKAVGPPTPDGKSAPTGPAKTPADGSGKSDK